MSIYISVIFCEFGIRNEVTKVCTLIIFSLLNLFWCGSSSKFRIHQISENIGCFLKVCGLTVKLFDNVILIYEYNIFRNIFYFFIIKVYHCRVAGSEILNKLFGISTFLDDKWEGIFSWIVFYLSNNPINYWHYFFTGSIHKISVS